MAQKFDSEQELAEHVIKWLKGKGYEVWEEVQPKRNASYADIVAQKDDELIIVECKKSYGASLISDAMKWVSYADRVAMAYPKRNWRDRRILRAYKAIVGMYEIEEWEVDKSLHKPYVFVKKEKRRDDPPLKNYITESLRPEHKEWAKAGSKDAQRVTDFQLTKYHLIEYVKKHQGTTLKEAVPNIGHHYASDESAYGSLVKYIEKGDIIKEITNEGTGRYMKLFVEN